MRSLLTSIILVFTISTIFVSCKKDDNDNGNKSNTNTYYFNCDFQGKNYYFDNQFLQAGNLDYYSGGFQLSASEGFGSSGGVAVRVSNSAFPTEAELLALAGDTIYTHIDSLPNAYVRFTGKENGTNVRYSSELRNGQEAGYVVINSVNPIGYDADSIFLLYEVEGTFNATVGPIYEDSVGTATGDFFIRFTL